MPSIRTIFAKLSALRGGALALAAVTAVPAVAQAGGTISWGDDQSVTIGLGLRSSFTSAEGGAPDGSRSDDFSLDSIRLYMGAQLNQYIKATFNTERDANGAVNVLDAYGQFELDDGFNVWVGRMLPPSDRSNLDGPYYLNGWVYPGVVSQYPAKFDGRDDGATVWGKLFDKKLVYSAGVFAGHNRFAGASNQGDHPLFAGRVAYSFLDAESDPGYYTSSTYYGAADILTLGVVGMHQTDGVGTSLRRGDYNAWNADLLYESKMASWGSVTLEGAYYDFRTGGVIDVAPGFGGSSATSNVGGIAAGKGYLIGADYLLPTKMGWGLVQPFGRYQEFDADITHAHTKQYDLGLNYVISGHNARISFDYSNAKVSGTPSNDKVILGVQLQF